MTPKEELDALGLLRFENEQLSNELKQLVKENKSLAAEVKRLQGELFMASYYKEDCGKPQQRE